MDSRFSECRRAQKSTNLQSQRLESPIEIQGQGDCKCSSDFQRTPKFWMNSDEGKKFKSKIREESDSESIPEEENKYSDPHFDCFLKRDHKYNHENDFESFVNLNTSWNSPYSRWISKSETVAPSEPPGRSLYTNSDEISQRFYEFQQKVEFLFRVFKEYENAQSHGQPNLTKAVGEMIGNVFHLFNLDSRMSTVEEGIAKLAVILEDLLKDPKKRKAPLFPEENLLFSEPSNFDEMNLTQRLNYLKGKNDLLKSLIKDFFNADSVEEIRSRVSSISKDYEFKKGSLNSNMDFEEARHPKDPTFDEIVESLKKLKKQMTEVQSKKCHAYEQPAKRSERREEQAPKFHGDNRLEVISEQAELVFTEDTENEDDMEEKKLIRSFKEKLSEFTEKLQENNLSGHDMTTRLSAQEAELLNSSLKKFQLELLSTLDTNGKKSFKTNLKDLRNPGREENKRQTKTDESTNRLTDNVENPENPTSDPSRIIKFSKREESTEPPKTSRNTPERISNLAPKQVETEAGKKLNEQSEGKSNVARKIPQKNSLKAFPSSTKGNRNRSFAVEDRSPLRHNSKNEEKEERPRPVTEPRPSRKMQVPLASKPPVPDHPKKNSGINNNKSKNKILLSKKSFVQTP